MPTKRLCTCILLPIYFFSLTGCVSSQGYSTQTSLEVPMTVRSPSDIPSNLVQYLPRFVAILEANGFAVGSTQDARALELVLQFNGNPFNFQVSTSLWHDGVPILTATATNPGWGTAINRGGALRSRVDSTVSVFDSELKELLTHTKIVPDRIGPDPQATEAHATEKSEDLYTELLKLDDLRERGILTEAEFDDQKRKLLEAN